MTSRTPHEAAQEYLRFRQRSVSCVSRSVITTRAYYGPEPFEQLTLGSGDPVPLRNPGQFSLRVSQTYRSGNLTSEISAYRVVVLAYMYALHDQSGSEVLSFHWHPRGRSPVTYPHFHLGAGARVGRPELQGCHIPTGMIALEQVIRLAIEELGVEPLRDDWSDVLSEGQAAFERLRAL